MSKRIVEKYDKLKAKTQKWIDECQKLQQNLDEEKELNNELLLQNKKLSTDLEQMKKQPSVQVDTDLMDELETENKSFRKEIRNLKQDNKTLVEKYRDKVSHLERDILLKDGQIQRLEEGKKDLQERYKELKEDYREQQRWNRQRVKE